MSKIIGIVGLAGLLLAVVSAFTVIPQINVMAVLVVAGVIAGIGYAEDRIVALMLAVLVYPVAAAALGLIPEVGATLSAIMLNIGLLAAGVASTVLVTRVIGIARGFIGDLFGSSDS
jgi:hypothetical protein